MSGPHVDEPAPDVMRIYDDRGEEGLTCRVCGALVSRLEDYPRAHWDWHETPNGA